MNPSHHPPLLLLRKILRRAINWHLTILLIYLLVHEFRDVGDRALKSRCIRAAGHDAQQIRVLGIIDDAAIMQVLLAGSDLPLPEFMCDGDSLRDSLAQTTVEIGTGEQGKRLLRILLRNKRRIEENPEERRILLYGKRGGRIGNHRGIDAEEIVEVPMVFDRQCLEEEDQRVVVRVNDHPLDQFIDRVLFPRGQMLRWEDGLPYVRSRGLRKEEFLLQYVWITLCLAEVCHHDRNL